MSALVHSTNDAMLTDLTFLFSTTSNDTLSEGAFVDFATVEWSGKGVISRIASGGGGQRKKRRSNTTTIVPLRNLFLTSALSKETNST